MHIPDAFLDAKTAVVTGAIAATGLGVALRQARLHLPRQRVPLMGLSAAFVFAAQMLNFPVAAGTSGHLVGGVLAAVLLGPGAAVIVISSVLIVQALMFADGGIYALGANIFNMAFIGAVGGYAIYRTVGRVLGGLRGKIVAAAFAAWCATVVGAIACAGELSLAGRFNWSLVFPAMASVHMLIGISEAFITALVLVSIGRVRPELLERAAAPVVGGYREMAIYGLLISLGLALFVSPLASKWPDGLDHTARMLGIAGEQLSTPALPAPIAEYRMPGFGTGALATSVAGAIGTIVVFALCLLLARVLIPSSNTKPAAGDSVSSQ